jgi:transposase
LKAQAQAHEDWLLVQEDECWFSRFAQPAAHAWAPPDTPLKLVQREPQRAEREKALACFGALRHDTQHVDLYFSQGQPNSEQMWVFIMGLLAIARQEGKRVLVIIWDNASWHKSRRIRQWIRAYNRQAKRLGEPRLLTHLLPIKSPWLNAIEPHWLHAKRATCEPDGDLPPQELRRRLAVHFQTKPLYSSCET